MANWTANAAPGAWEKAAPGHTSKHAGGVQAPSAAARATSVADPVLQVEARVPSAEAEVVAGDKDRAI